VLLRFYADESYSKSAFSFGGWLAGESEFVRLESQWIKRLEFERRKHGKFERFHATNCNAKTEDYAGWSDRDKIEHTKALLRIVTRRKLVAVCAGLDRSALLKVYPEEVANDPLEPAYNLTVKQLMMMVSRYVKKDSGYRVAIIHDWAGERYNAVIQQAFAKMRDDTRWSRRDLFISCTPMKWRDCTPLQAADMIAFDTRKLLDGTIHSTPQMRRSLQAILDKGTPVKARYFNEKTLQRLRQLGSEGREQIAASHNRKPQPIGVT
jgi:hypothetical protein